MSTGSGEGDTLISSCAAGRNEVCEWFDCGEPWSRFDQNLCYRPVCRDSSECGADERCSAPVLFAQPSCVSSSIGDVMVDSSCECYFGETGDCVDTGYCLRDAEHPLVEECATDAKTCNELERWEASFDLFDLTGSGGGTTDLSDALRSCHAKVAQALAACTT